VIISAGITMKTLWNERDDVETVVLDEPGEYQEPGIGTNTDLTGQPIPMAFVEDVDGHKVGSLEFLMKGKPVIVNIWFSTCQPCKREMPALQAAFEKWGDRVEFVGINPQDSVERLEEFVDEFGVTYPQYRDTSSDFVVASGVATFPSTLIIGTDGNVEAQYAGEMTAAEIDTALASVTG
jgi:thiol-disulfide isomerase/thioredoxin